MVCCQTPRPASMDAHQGSRGALQLWAGHVRVVHVFLGSPLGSVSRWSSSGYEYTHLVQLASSGVEEAACCYSLREIPSITELPTRASKGSCLSEKISTMPCQGSCCECNHRQVFQDRVLGKQRCHLSRAWQRGLCFVLFCCCCRTNSCCTAAALHTHLHH